MAGCGDDPPVCAARCDCVAIGNVFCGEIVLHGFETLHSVEGGRSVCEDAFVQRIHVNRHLKALQQAFYAPDMVEMAVREKDCVRSEGMDFEKVKELLEPFFGGHAGIDYGAVWAIIGPRYYTVGSQRVEGEYSGMQHKSDGFGNCKFNKLLPTL